MKKMIRYSAIALGVILFSALGLAIYLYASTRPLHPDHFILKALQGTVDIQRDAHGVPHIQANTSDEDAFYALGYVEAEDRLWQMEFQRRISQGTLSEIFGKEALPKDEFLRTIGFYHSAEKAWPALSKETQTYLIAFSKGVNAFIAEKHLPLEFKLLRIHPKSWTPIDSIAWQKMMAWDLQHTWEDKINNYLVLKKLGLKSVLVLFPSYPLNAPTVLSAKDLDQSGLIKIPLFKKMMQKIHEKAEEIDLDAKTVSALNHSIDISKDVRRDLHLQVLSGVGSNNWVVSGKWTQSGKPLLANDPHLGLQAPAIWYLAEIKSPHFQMAGGVMPGTPFIAIGHNADIAWGVTNVNPDTQELFVLPKEAKLTAREEIIPVRGQADVHFTVYESAYGPIISHITPAGQVAQNVAFQWTALAANDTTVDSFMKIDQAHNWTEFVNALRYFVAPSQNFIYADKAGNIGYYLPGKIPLRDKYLGYFPMPADPKHQWIGYIPFEKLPHVFNPPEGFIVSANNKAVPDVYPYPLTFRWKVPPFRAARIRTLLQSLKPLTVEKMETIQMDNLSNAWFSLKPLLLKSPSSNLLSDLGLTILKNWDGHTDQNSIGATVFAYWLENLAAMPNAKIDLPFKEIDAELIKIQLETNGEFCRDPKTKTCDLYLKETLASAMNQLSKRLGSNSNHWQWGRVHQAMFTGLGLGQHPWLGWIWNRHISTAGGFETVNVGTYNSDFAQTDAPGYRQIIDLSDMNHSVFIQSLGQSGDPLSKHYDDLMPMWESGQYIPINS